ncbi:creatininase family protein [Cetobacterium sp.]|uniref:creatininase family protein n=1 Tax=Cetobacterium sp. TaxID=2071632 RepID=UPI003F2DEBD9
MLNSIVDSLLNSGLKKFIFVNGHGGNISAIDQVGLDTFEKGGLVATIDWWNLAKLLNLDYDDGHGDIQETSTVRRFCKFRIL